jgi:hypothetical protein
MDAGTETTTGTSPIMETENEIPPPHTPVRKMASDQMQEPTSSKVTINLKPNTNHGPMFSPPLCPETPTKSGTDRFLYKQTNEAPASQNTKTIASAKIPSSSSSPPRSPEVELLIDDDNEDSCEPHTSTVAIIDNDDDLDDEITLEIDPMQMFPYSVESESLCSTVRKIARFLEYGRLNESQIGRETANN